MRQFFFLLGLLLPGPARSQLEQTIFESIRLENGSVLHSAAVFAIAEDAMGYAWFGSDNGLARYDGYVAHTFQFDAADPASLNDNRVRALYSDRQGRFWVGTQTGANCYVPDARAFRRIRLKDHDGDFSAVHFWETPDGNLWASSGRGLLRYRPEEDVFEKIALRTPDGQPLRSWSWFTADRTGQCWGLVNGDLARVSPADSLAVPLPLPAGLLGDRPELHRICPDSKGRLWLMGWPGVLYFTPADGICRRLELPRAIRNPLSRCMVEDARGRIWLSFRFDGLAVWDENLENPAVFTTDPANPFGLLSKRVFSLYLDRRQTLWLGTLKGVQKCRPDNPFLFYQNVTGLSDERNLLYTFGEDARGGVWMGTVEQPMYSPRLGAVPAGIPVNQQHARRGEVRIKDVFDFLRDRSGAVWMATGRGMNRCLPGGFTEPVQIAPDLDQHPVIGLADDPDDPDYFWALGMKGMLRIHHANLRDTTWFRLKRPLSGSQTSRLLVDRQGGFWLTHQGVLTHFDRKTGIFTHFHPKTGSPDTPAPTGISCTALGGPGTLWVGSSSGLTRLDFSCRPDGSFDTTRLVFRHYTTADGLPDNRILSVIADAGGRVWFTTFSALSCLDPADGSLHHFPVGSHPIGGFNRHASDPLAGRMAIGGINGFWLFDPDKIRRDSASVPLVLTDFKINNLSYALPKPPDLTREIVLTHRQNIFSFEWAALLPATPEGLQYVYRLEGYDADWSPLSARRYATFTNVPPGVYFFQVKTLKPDGVWSAEVLNLKVVITPAWWQTRWFQALLILLALVIGYFIWENERQKRQLRSQKALAEQNARYKSKFLANVSHEIRTPLNAIVGLNKLLLDTPLNPKQSEYATAIHQSSENLLWLVNDILDQAKIESGRYSFARRDFDLGVIFQQLRNTFYYRATEKNLAFDIVCPPEAPLQLNGDPLRLYQILTNLTANAVKFTERGSVTVRVRLLDRTEDRVALRFDVSDTGPGIPPERLTEIFESFRRLDDDPVSAAQQGAGLGLSIAKELVEQQGGALTVESVPGQGSVFSVQLGFGPGAATAAPEIRVAAPFPALNGLHVLLVEDTPFNQLLAVELLKKHLAGVVIDVADNGRIAVEKVRQHTYDIVLMDVKMPVLDGLSATRLIRDLPGDAARVPIIGLTANAIPEQIVRCREAGMDEVVTKPVEADELLRKIAQLTRYA